MRIESLSVPQTISIATGAVLITLVDFRVEIVAMFVGVAISAVYLLTRGLAEATPEASPAVGG